jgi:RNA polymerase sigma-70 factor (ECF subfamily)
MSGTIQIEELYERYAHLLLGRCRVLLGNDADAEEALQEVFVKAMRSMDGFRGESSLLTWLYRIATNHCLNMLRSRRRHREHLRQNQEAQTVMPAESGLAIVENVSIIRELLHGVDRRSQELAILYFVDGMNQEEAARETGLSVPTVRKYLERFIQKARKRR